MAEAATPQDEVLAFLADPAAHGGRKVQRIDTHAASVFLAGDRVLKVKRAVRFPFLDYTTLDKRRQACAAELAVNASYAPEIYRGVVPITADRGRGDQIVVHAATGDLVGDLPAPQDQHPMA